MTESNPANSRRLTHRKASDPDFDEFVAQERGPGIEHGWTVMDLVGGQLQEIMGTWGVYPNRRGPEVDRLNELDDAERDVVGLRGTAVLAYYSS